jgi:hypothetical protein
MIMRIDLLGYAALWAWAGTLAKLPSKVAAMAKGAISFFMGLPLVAGLRGQANTTV